MDLYDATRRRTSAYDTCVLLQKQREIIIVCMRITVKIEPGVAALLEMTQEKLKAKRQDIVNEALFEGLIRIVHKKKDLEKMEIRFGKQKFMKPLSKL